MQDTMQVIIIHIREVAYTSYRLLSKVVTLNDPELRNGRYFALFHRIRYSVREFHHNDIG